VKPELVRGERGGGAGGAAAQTGDGKGAPKGIWLAFGWLWTEGREDGVVVVQGSRESKVV
jgi:hypothetical protein